MQDPKTTLSRRRAGQPGKRRLVKDGTMNCLDCGPQPLSEFYEHKNQKTGRAHRDSRCHACRRLHLAARNFAISAAQYRAFIESAKGCAICGTLKSKLVLDHCHTTGKLRGVLCQLCNTALAAIENRPDFAILACEYLERWADAPTTIQERAEGRERERRLERIRESAKKRQAPIPMRQSSCPCGRPDCLVKSRPRLRVIATA